MFDKIEISIQVSDNECEHLVRVHKLEPTINKDGVVTKYTPTDYKNITGAYIKIILNKKTGTYTAKISVSLHKHYNYRNFGKLQNDTLFTISESKSAIEGFLSENGILPIRASVKYFELGLNLETTFNPLTFIEKTKYGFFQGKDGLHRVKTMFIDANYQLNRQKTTEKHSDIRKYYKIYDKLFEQGNKKRGKDKEEFFEKNKNRNVLRIETVYKRHSERADIFFKDENLKRLVYQFYLNWKDLFFEREIQAYKGARKSEAERAKKIVNIGIEKYLQEEKKKYDLGKITAKQYRTIREFVRDFHENENKFKTVVSEQEKEYKVLLNSTFKRAKI